MASLKEERANRIERLRTDFTETEKVLLNRRSVRLYTKEAVPEFMVKRILAVGFLSETFLGLPRPAAIARPGSL